MINLVIYCTRETFTQSIFFVWSCIAQLSILLTGQPIKLSVQVNDTIQLCILTVIRTVVITILLQIMHHIYVFGTNMPMSKAKQMQAISKNKKEISSFHFPATTRIMTISDIHLGHNCSKPREVMETIQYVNPDVLVIKGDLYDSKKWRTDLFDTLRPEEKKLEAYLREFHQMPNKEIILLRGDHDWWLTDDNPMNVPVYAKATVSLGNHAFLATHSDEYDINKQRNGGWFSRMFIDPTFHALTNQYQQYDSITAGTLLSQISQHPHFLKVLRQSKRAGVHEAVALGCEVVDTGHLHIKHKFYSRKKVNGRRVRYVMLRGAHDAPRQYVSYKVTKKGLEVHIKTYKPKNR